MIELLQTRQRLSYRALKREPDLNEEYLEDMKEELRYSHSHTIKEEDSGLVWVGDGATPVPSSEVRGPSSIQPPVLSESVASAKVLLLVNYRPEYRPEWGQKTYSTQLRLAPLGKGRSRGTVSPPCLAPAQRVPLRTAGVSGSRVHF
jgi:hypothetical protein